MSSHAAQNATSIGAGRAGRDGRTCRRSAWGHLRRCFIVPNSQRWTLPYPTETRSPCHRPTFNLQAARLISVALLRPGFHRLAGPDARAVGTSTATKMSGTCSRACGHALWVRHGARANACVVALLLRWKDAPRRIPCCLLAAKPSRG
jgi:hypothetical protein